MSRPRIEVAFLCLVAACTADRDSATGDTSSAPATPALAGTPDSAARPAPTGPFTIALWPGEGIPVIEVRRARVLLRARPEPASEVVDTLVGEPGARVTYDSTRYQTIESGLIRVISPLQVTGRDLGPVEHLSRERYQSKSPPQVADSMAPPATIEYLQDRAEGTCFVRMGQRVIDADPCPALGQGNVRVERRPTTRWWIGVRGLGGRFGWVVVSDTTARAVRREF